MKYVININLKMSSTNVQFYLFKNRIPCSPPFIWLNDVMKNIIYKYIVIYSESWFHNQQFASSDNSKNVTSFTALTHYLIRLHV